MATFKKGDKVKVVNELMRSYLTSIGAVDTGVILAASTSHPYNFVELSDGIKIGVTTPSLELIKEEVKQDFNTQAEVWEYLLTGEPVQHINNAVMQLLDGKVHVLESGKWYEQSAPSFYNYGDYKKYTEPKWYENIPTTGILCWCWGHFPEEEGQLDLIVGYKTGEEIYPFKVKRGTCWVNARPATLEEVKKYMVLPK